MSNGKKNGNGNNGAGEHYADGVCVDTWLEVVKPTGIEARYKVCLLDDGEHPSHVFVTNADATATFRIELVGELWECTCGVICVEMNFDGGPDGDFRLSDLVGGPIEIPFDGAQDLNPDLSIPIPAGTFPVGNGKADYTVSATAVFRNNAGKTLRIGGGDQLGQIVILAPDRAGV